MLGDVSLVGATAAFGPDSAAWAAANEGTEEAAGSIRFAFCPYMRALCAAVIMSICRPGTPRSMVYPVSEGQGISGLRGVRNADRCCWAFAQRSFTALTFRYNCWDAGPCVDGARGAAAFSEAKLMFLTTRTQVFSYPIITK